MSRAPSPLTGPALWEYLRDESAAHHESTGQWPVSETYEDLVSHVCAFCAMVMVPNSSVADFHDGGCTIRGELLPRWSPIGGAGMPLIAIKVTPNPRGEIHLTSEEPPLSIEEERERRMNAMRSMGKKMLRQQSKRSLNKHRKWSVEENWRPALLNTHVRH